jgi:type VI secretion system protein VasG
VVGEAGVGKTAVVEGLALRVVEGDVPDILRDVSILSLDMGLLQAGAGVKGEFENRLKSVIDEIKASPKPIIVFIDEAHTLIGAGGTAGGSDAANLLKPALARGELRTVAATTWSEYKKYFERDAALARRFQLVKLDEPSEETAVLILRGLKEKYEETHGVVVRDDAIEAAAELSSRYISGRQLPDKAVDLLDTSAARVKILLSAKPDIIEDRERNVQALEREKSALERDQLHGLAIDEDRFQEIEANLEKLNQELGDLKERWLKEQELATKLIGLRKELYELRTQEEPGDGEDELKSQIDATAQELETLQGD